MTFICYFKRSFVNSKKLNDSNKRNYQIFNLISNQLNNKKMLIEYKIRNPNQLNHNAYATLHNP